MLIASGLGTVVTWLQHLCGKTLTLGTVENILLKSMGSELTLMHFLNCIIEIFQTIFQMVFTKLYHNHVSYSVLTHIFLKLIHCHKLLHCFHFNSPMFILTVSYLGSKFEK